MINDETSLLPLSLSIIRRRSPVKGLMGVRMELMRQNTSFSREELEFSKKNHSEYQEMLSGTRYQ